MKTTREILQDEKAPLVALTYAVTKRYGVDCYSRAPELLRESIEQDYSIKLTDLQSDKIQAGITILTTDLFETDINTFETCCHLANNHPDSFEDLNPVEPEELIIGILDAYLIRAESIEYDGDVNTYAGKIFFDYGFSNPPTLFPSAIMPHYRPDGGDDTEKNAALEELFNARMEQLGAYIDSIKS